MDLFCGACSPFVENFVENIGRYLAGVSSDDPSSFPSCTWERMSALHALSPRIATQQSRRTLAPFVSRGIILLMLMLLLECHAISRYVPLGFDLKQKIFLFCLNELVPAFTTFYGALNGAFTGTAGNHGWVEPRLSTLGARLSTSRRPALDFRRSTLDCDSRRCICEMGISLALDTRPSALDSF